MARHAVAQDARSNDSLRGPANGSTKGILHAQTDDTIPIDSQWIEFSYCQRRPSPTVGALLEHDAVALASPSHASVQPS